MDSEIQQSIGSISIYESRALILITGLCRESNRYHLIEVQRSLGSSDKKREMVLHPDSYSSSDVDVIVSDFKCVSIISDAYLIFGFVQLMESCYIVVVTKAESVANIHGHDIFTITETNLLPMTYKVRNTMEESRYKSILQNFNLAHNNFFFSYSYDLTLSSQQNFSPPVQKIYSDSGSVGMKYAWNYYPLKFFNDYGMVGTLGVDSSDAVTKRDLSSWLVPVIHGFCKQIKVRLSSGDIFMYTLIARRSRCFAGTRYLRRGVDSNGFTANEVETEQVVSHQKNGGNMSCRSSSLCQIRGSIPLYWYHTNLYIPSPDIKICERDLGYDSALHHFNLLKDIYGDRITVLNLVRTESSVREVVVGSAFEQLVNDLNKYYKIQKNTFQSGQNFDSENMEHENCAVSQSSSESAANNSNTIKYVAFDFHGTPHSSLFPKLDEICKEIFPDSGFFLQAESVEKNEDDCTVQYSSYPNESDKYDLYDHEKKKTTLKNEETKSVTHDSSSVNDGCDVENSVGRGVPAGLVQVGVLRTNCIDCLDRTNVAQFCYARHSLFFQFKALGAELSHSHMQDLESICSEIWSEHGDVIANQYGGSGAMHSLTTSKSSLSSTSTSHPPETTPTKSSWDFLGGWGKSSSAPEGEREFVLSGGAKNAIVAVQRYYSNISTDFERQQSIDLLLGEYIPQRGNVSIWDLDMYVPTMSRGKNVYPAIQSEPGPADSVPVMSSVEITESDVSDNGVIIGIKSDNKSELKDDIEYKTLPQNGKFSQISPPVTIGKFSSIPFNRDKTTAATVSDLKFPRRDVNYTGIRNLPQGVSPGSHDVIVLDNIHSKPYPPISLDSRNSSRSKPLQEKLSGQILCDAITESNPRSVDAHASSSSEYDGDKDDTGMLMRHDCENNNIKSSDKRQPLNYSENKSNKDNKYDENDNIVVEVAAIFSQDNSKVDPLNTNEFHPQSHTVLQENTSTLNEKITPTQEPNSIPSNSTHKNTGYFSWLF